MGAMTLEARSLEVAYARGETVLRDADFALAPGSFVCLLGPNGAGKSTLLRALAGLVTPTRGEVRLDDVPLHGIPLAERARRIGFLPQEVHPAFSYTVEESVALGARVAGHGSWFDPRLGDEARAAVQAALATVEAEHLLGRTLDTLSGGERRRVLLASVLAQEPDYLLLDEPGAMLDLQHQVGVFRALAALAERGLGVLCVTHDANLAAAFAGELALLADGHVRARGAAAEVLQREHLHAAFGDHFELLARGAGAPVVLPR